MKSKLLLVIFIPFYSALFACQNSILESWPYYINKHVQLDSKCFYCIQNTTDTFLSSDTTLLDSAHYWKLKPGLDSQNEKTRIDPDNYIDMGIITPPSKNDPCNTGYVELCGIYVIPNPANKNQPYFSKSVNADIYQALRKNEFLEQKVFYKDL